MDLVELLESNAPAIIDDAVASLERSRLPHYDELDAAERRRRLEDLLGLVIRCLRERDLVPMIDHAGAVAHARFEAGVDIHEVQTAFNVLEESVWSRVVDGTPPRHLADAIGMITTVLGTGKDALARAYVSLAAHQHVPSLDLTALFRGA
jgi:hypothetical protein